MIVNGPLWIAPLFEPEVEDVLARVMAAIFWFQIKSDFQKWKSSASAQKFWTFMKRFQNEFAKNRVRPRKP